MSQTLTVNCTDGVLATETSHTQKQRTKHLDVISENSLPTGNVNLSCKILTNHIVINKLTENLKTVCILYCNLHVR